MSAKVNREFRFSRQEFEQVRALVKKTTGINLEVNRYELVYNRLAGRLRVFRLRAFSEYLALIRDSNGEFVNFINAITTNVTSFFREQHHFEYLTQTILSSWRAQESRRRIRIWSAGCSSGEEPYSIAMVLKENLNEFKDWDIKILATDLDSSILEKAKRGIYPEECVLNLNPERRRLWFRRGRGGNKGFVRVCPSLQELITFKQLNLMHKWPFKGPIDLIFCRNVVIYFDKETTRNLIAQFYQILTNDGHLFMGHSESIMGTEVCFDRMGRTIYRKNFRKAA